MLSRNVSNFKAGMYLLETLTSGMYNEPLSIFREYIQNSADSIDKTTSKSGQLKIDININPFEETLTIKDNGNGLSAEIAASILGGIGDSPKRDKFLRGFRGIGRLGGLAFCKKATFRTKTFGEKVETIQEWNCDYLQKAITDPNKTNMTLEELFYNATNTYIKNGKGDNSSYFIVKMEGVHSFRNYILDIMKIRQYLSQVAPLPFDYKIFSYGKEIDLFLNQNLGNYSSYNIYLNNDKLFKNYSDNVETTKKADFIENVKYFKLKAGGKDIAVGWYGNRSDMIGSLSTRSRVSGIRVRVGNILVGDNHLLDNCFREPRFNNYLIGEVHINTHDLIPNSRRDNFVDNEVKNVLFNQFEEVVGIPMSKEIRKRSVKKNPKIKDNNITKNEMDNYSKDNIKLQIKKNIDMNEKEEMLDLNNHQKNMFLAKVLNKNCGKCKNVEKVLDDFIR